MPEDLTILLEDLKVSDPKTWTLIDCDLLDVFEQFDSEEQSRLESYLIQGELQRACQARGWNWQVQTWNTSNLKFYIAYITGDGKEEYEEGQTPASALLAAYLKAIEKEKPCQT